MNIATLIGLVAGIAILIVSMATVTTSLGVFLDVHGIGIVMGGTLGALFICYPMKEVFRTMGILADVMKSDDLPIGNYIAELEGVAQQAFTKGTMKMEVNLEGSENEFMKDGLQMIIDQKPVDKVREYLEACIDTTFEGGMAEAGIFKVLAVLAPAFGLVGTVIGLIAMFQAMSAGLGEEATTVIGKSMATSLCATLYGVILSNLVFTPVATKYKRRIEERIVLMTVIMEGLTLIAKRTPPELVKDRLKAYLPARKWGSIKAPAGAPKAAKAT